MDDLKTIISSKTDISFLAYGGMIDCFRSQKSRTQFDSTKNQIATIYSLLTRV